MYQIFQEFTDGAAYRAVLRVGRLIKTPAAAAAVAKRKSKDALVEIRDMGNRIVAIFRDGIEIGGTGIGGLHE